MANKYRVELIQQVGWTLTIEANSMEEANQIARDNMCDGDWGKPSGWENIEIDNIELENI